MFFKKVSSALFACLLLSGLGILSRAQAPQSNSTVTLYSAIKHRGERRTFCLNFQTGPSSSGRADCDLAYGSLYAGDDLDWFQSATGQGDRSVIKDLGDHLWTAKFEVPVVEPLPKLKPGEQRQIGVDTSGADGADGAPGSPGSPGSPGRPGADYDGVVRAQPLPPVAVPASPVIRIPARPKNDGKPKIDPVFVKAVVGHVYVIHVVDDTRDFYALFRVEALQRGDQVEVSWRLIPGPSKPSE
jgi:hypothetical protein